MDALRTLRARRTGWLTYELFFVVSLIGLLVVVSLIGLLVVVEFTSPIHVRPPWRKRVRWLVLVGIAGFLVVLARRTAAVLPAEVI